MEVLGYLINGISIGSVYAIIALGYTMVYGIAKMLNFAHGDVIMVGTYIAFFAFEKFNLPAPVAIILAMAFCVVLGILIEGLAYRPLRGAPSLAVLITAIGVSYFLQNAAQLMFSADPRPFTIIPVTTPPLSLFGGQLIISVSALITMAICVVVMIGLTLFTGKTRTGKAMRAVAEDRDAAQLMGINVNRTISITFAIGSGLAAVAGVLLCSVTLQQLQPSLGAMPGIKAFTAAVLGGIGSIPGAMLGGILLGVIEILGQSYLSAQLSDAIVFGVLILILLVKPTGLLGKQVQEKV